MVLARRLIVSLLIAAALAPAAMAAEPTRTPMTFDVVVGPNDDTHCKIVADLYKPAGASKSHPVPAVMGTNGFGGSKDDFSDLGPAYARRGYAFLAYSGLGFGNSGCKITLDDPDWDGKAGKQLVTFLGKTDFIKKDKPGDPRVGMIGGSYGGQIQFAIAGLDRRLDAIVPQITWNDLSYSLGPNNTDFRFGTTYRTPGVIKLDWPVLFSALGLGQGFQQAVANQDPSHLGACPNFSDQVCQSLVTSSINGYPDDATLALLRHASVSQYMSRIRIPTLLAQGQSDTLFNLQEAVATYNALRAQGTPVKMLWRSSGHSGGSIDGESDSTNLEKSYESRMELQWFNYWLKRIPPKPALDFSFLRDWVPYKGDAAPQVGVTPRYPAGPAQTVYLSGGDELVSNRSAVRSGSANFASIPSATGSGNGFVEAPVPDAPGTFATYDTGPLFSTTDIVGIPRLRIRINAPTFGPVQGQSPGTKLILFAKLLDVDGSKTTLPRNLLSASRVADVNKPVDIQLPGIVHRFPKGHRIRLVVSTSNSTNRGNTVPGPVSILTDQSNPGTLTLPKVGKQVRTLPGRCLATRAPIGPRNIGRIRVGWTRARLLRRVIVQPEKRSARVYRYCVKGRQGVVKAVFSSRSSRAKSLLVTTTARGHGNRNVRVRSAASKFRRAYPRRKRIARGLYRANRRSPRIFGVRRGRVTFIAVANKKILRSRRTLRRYLRRAGVR